MDRRCDKIAERKGMQSAETRKWRPDGVLQINAWEIRWFYRALALLVPEGRAFLERRQPLVPW